MPLCPNEGAFPVKRSDAEALEKRCGKSRTLLWMSWKFDSVVSAG